MKYHIKAKHLCASDMSTLYPCHHGDKFFNNRKALNINNYAPWGYINTEYFGMNCFIFWLVFTLELLGSMMMNLSGRQWQCSTCGSQSKSTNVRYHIESKHMRSSSQFVKKSHLQTSVNAYNWCLKIEFIFYQTPFLTLPSALKLMQVLW